jgi:GAF domain-containing protein
VPQSSNDTTLTALAQLATLRLDCCRAFVSLIDSNHQYVLAEATRTLSLRSDARHLEGDGLWLGSVVLERSKGVCGLLLEEDAISLSPSHPDTEKANESSIFIIEDLRQHPRCTGAAFTHTGPRLQFYAGIPIRTNDGAVIGVFSVFDNKPRVGLTTEQQTFLEDIALTVMDHLDGVRIRSDHSLKSSQLNGLESFIDGLTSARTAQEVADHRFHTTTEDPKELAQQDAVADRPRLQRITTTDPEDHQSGEPDSSSSSLWDQALPAGSKPMFSRAAKIVRQSGNYDGVAFFYMASHNLYKAPSSLTTGLKSDYSKSRRGSLHGTLSRHSDNASEAHEKVRGISDSESLSPGDNRPPSAPCPVLAYSLAPGEAQNVRSGSLSRFRQRDMELLIGKSPKARTFTLNRAGEVLPGDTSSSGSGAEQTIAAIVLENPELETPTTDGARARALGLRKKQTKALQRLGPNGLSFACLPLWDFERQRWLAYCICWTNSPGRHFREDGDLSVSDFKPSLSTTLLNLSD